MNYPYFEIVTFIRLNVFGLSNTHPLIKILPLKIFIHKNIFEKHKMANSKNNTIK